MEPQAAEAREKAENPSAEKNRFPREKLHDVVGGGSVGSRGIERSGHLLPSLALGQVAEEEEARRCHRHGRRTGTNAIGWLAGLAARLPLPLRAVQGQAVAAGVEGHQGCRRHPKQSSTSSTGWPHHTSQPRQLAM